MYACMYDDMCMGYMYLCMICIVYEYNMYDNLYTYFYQTGECLPEVRALQWLNLKQCELGPVGGQVTMCIYMHICALLACS